MTSFIIETNNPKYMNMYFFTKERNGAFEVIQTINCQLAYCLN